MPPVPDPSPAPLETRRKILRAGFGVPVITAVGSGRALAATSATCLARQLSAPVYPAVTDGGTDRYLRVQLGKLTNGATITYYVDGRNIAALAPRLTKSTSYSLTERQVRLFTIGTNTEATSSSSSPPSPGTYVQAGGKYAVLRFDSSGQIVGVGASSTAAQSAVTDSCWSSAAP